MASWFLKTFMNLSNRMLNSNRIYLSLCVVRQLPLEDLNLHHLIVKSSLLLLHSDFYSQIIRFVVLFDIVLYKCVHNKLVSCLVTMQI